MRILDRIWPAPAVEQSVLPSRGAPVVERRRADVARVEADLAAVEAELAGLDDARLRRLRDAGDVDGYRAALDRQRELSDLLPAHRARVAIVRKPLDEADQLDRRRVAAEWELRELRTWFAVEADLDAAIAALDRVAAERQLRHATAGGAEPVTDELLGRALVDWRDRREQYRARIDQLVAEIATLDLQLGRIERRDA